MSNFLLKTGASAGKPFGEGGSVYDYLQKMAGSKATDIYITCGVPLSFRIDDDIKYADVKPLDEEDIQKIFEDLTNEKQREEFEKKNELNFGMDMTDVGRFRVNVMRQRQKIALVIRRIISKIPTFEELRLPKIMEKLSLEKRGLVLIVGGTSSGKSTSLAAMVDYRNQVMGGHIVTIENPIEYYFEHKKGIVNQREVGIDTDSFHTAIKNALRQKPDVILVGEIRDTEVMEQAIVAAETGHLCYATLHTSSASQAIDRIVNFFPEERHYQIRIALATNLKAIVAQRLVKKRDGGMIVVPEVLLNEALIKDLILKGESKKIHEVMANNVNAGMSTFDISLFNLYKENLISEQTAVNEAELSADMKIKIKNYKMTSEYQEKLKKAKESGNYSEEDYSPLNIDTSGLSL